MSATEDRLVDDIVACNPLLHGFEQIERKNARIIAEQLAQRYVTLPEYERVEAAQRRQRASMRWLIRQWSAALGDKVGELDLEPATAAICEIRDDVEHPAHPGKPTCAYSRMLAKAALEAAVRGGGLDPEGALP